MPKNKGKLSVSRKTRSFRLAIALFLRGYLKCMSISSLQNQPIPSPLSLENHSQNNISVSEDEGTAKTNSTKTQEKTSFFENFLNRSDKNTRPSNEVLNQKLADIRHKAKLVKSHPLPNIISDYVKEVKGFLTDVKDHAYKHQMNDDGLFEKMELVDKKLADIGDKILEDNKNELELVANLGELEGLLIDFYI
jgi:uncharacterized protein YaaR (DUF327 family)